MLLICSLFSLFGVWEWTRGRHIHSCVSRGCMCTCAQAQECLRPLHVHSFLCTWSHPVMHIHVRTHPHPHTHKYSLIHNHTHKEKSTLVQTPENEGFSVNPVFWFEEYNLGTNTKCDNNSDNKIHHGQLWLRIFYQGFDTMGQVPFSCFFFSIEALLIWRACGTLLSPTSKETSSVIIRLARSRTASPLLREEAAASILPHLNPLSSYLHSDNHPSYASFVAPAPTELHPGLWTRLDAVWRTKKVQGPVCALER